MCSFGDRFLRRLHRRCGQATAESPVRFHNDLHMVQLLQLSARCNLQSCLALPCLALQSADSDLSRLVLTAYRKGSTLVNMLLIIMKDMVYLFVVVALLIFAFAGGCAAAFQMLLAVRIWAPFMMNMEGAL